MSAVAAVTGRLLVWLGTFVVLMLTLALAFAGSAGYTPRDGDVVFHTSTSTSAQSLAIQQATGSAYSHMGIVLLRAGKPFVFEAVSPVRYTPLASWLARGKQGHYVVRRPLQELDGGQVQRLRKSAERYAGKPYDLQFGWSDARIYCSELVWKMYRDALGIELAPLQRLRDFDLSAPAVRAKLAERYGDTLPLDEPVIAPSALFASPLLGTVATR